VNEHNPDPRILLHPNIPKPVHGIAPRLILGSSWWNRTRKAACASQRFHCHACGVHSDAAIIRPWLEGHEMYDIDYTAGTVTYKHTVALCHACHNFIHSGRLKLLYDTGKLDKSTFDRIREHGARVLNNAGLCDDYVNINYSCLGAPWEAWRMIVSGEAYGPSSDSYAMWERGAWRTYKPPKHPKQLELSGCTTLARLK